MTRAIEELRELARGVRPACLDDGLAPALRELAARAALRTEVAATSERFAEPIEAAAYFVASEALTNSVKHARASRATVSAERRNGSLVLRIDDDGIGGAVASERSGLAGITDRVAALGGSVSVSSPPGHGHRRRRGAAVRVVIAEDQALLREGLRRLFEDAGHEVVAAVDDADRLRGAVSEHEPDLAIVDVRMPPTHTDEGMRAARWIRDAHPAVGVFVLSQHIETTGAVGLVSQGGFGYFLKDRVLDVGRVPRGRAARRARRFGARSARRRVARRRPGVQRPRTSSASASARCCR